MRELLSSTFTGLALSHAAMQSFDLIVIGCGGVGSAALAAAARRGARVVGLDRFGPAHDRGSSHGRTRLIRRAYFEHASYVPLVERSFELWRELEARTGAPLLHDVGLLEIGPADGEVVRGVLASARQHGLKVEELSVAEAQRRFDGFIVPEHLAAVFEFGAGILHVEACVRAHLDDAAAHGAQLVHGATVERWSVSSGVATVETDQGAYSAARLIIAAGPWAGQLLQRLSIPLRVVRKPQFWYAAEGDSYRADRLSPAFLYEMPEGIFYGFPRLDEHGVKIAEHSGGQPVTDPLTVDRTLDALDHRRVEAFASSYLPRVTTKLIDHSVCMYTLTPDSHFIVDRHPEHAEVAFAAGLSGHGFKFTPVLGQALVDLSLDGRTNLPIDFLSIRRKSLGLG